MANATVVYNVVDEGAKGDGSTDDAQAIRLALTAATPTGGIVFFPAGTYLIKSGLIVPPGVTLLGTGWNTPGSELKAFMGSWIVVDNAYFFASNPNVSPVHIDGNSGAVRNLAFNVLNQSTTGPADNVQPIILVTGSDTLIEDVFLYNPYDGIYITGRTTGTKQSSTGRLVVRRIFGQPLRYGIKIDCSKDTDYIDSIHFWSYWQPSGNAWTYQRNNGTAIGLFRCDNPDISNVLASNYQTGLSLSVSDAGCPHKVHLVNADFDDCVIGIHIDCPEPKSSDEMAMQMSNVTVQAPSNAGTASYGIWIENGPASTTIQASNLHITDSGGNAIRIDAQNVVFYGENIWLENWLTASPGGSSPAVPERSGFYIVPPTSFACLGPGFIARSSSTNCMQFSPPGQFVIAWGEQQAAEIAASGPAPGTSLFGQGDVDVREPSPAGDVDLAGNPAGQASVATPGGAA